MTSEEILNILSRLDRLEKYLKDQKELDDRIKILEKEETRKLNI